VDQDFNGAKNAGCKAVFLERNVKAAKKDGQIQSLAQLEQ